MSGFVPTTAHRDDINVCTNCNEETDFDDWNGETEQCESCYYETHTACADCGDMCDDDDMKECTNYSYSTRNRRGSKYCESCFSNDHFECHSCGDDYHNDDSRACEGGYDYCEDCYCETFTSCDGCDRELEREGYDVHCTENGETYCDCCYDEYGGEDWDQDRHWSGCAEFDKIGSSRKFGVELETSESPNYSDWARNTGWGAKEDGSVSGKEFVSPPMYGNDGYASVMDFCNKMDRNGCEVTDSCGFHLHIDLSDTNASQRKSIALAYHYTRMVWESFTDSSRHDTYYARRSSSSRHYSSADWDRKKIVDGNDKPTAHCRYVWLNWNSFNKFSTVEVRSHEPTCDGRAVCNWIKAHTNFVDKVKDMTVGQVTRMFGSECPKTIMRELRFMWDDKELSDYYTRKAKNN